MIQVLINNFLKSIILIKSLTMNMRRFILLDKEGRVITDAQHLEEAKHKLESYPTAYAIYDSKRGMIRMLKLEEAIHER